MGIFFNEFNRYKGKTESGQVFTSEHIAGFMCKLIDIHKDDRVLDAACGSGAFLIRAMSPLRQAGVFSFALGSKSRSFAYNTKGQIRKWCAMQDITLNVIDEERLYNPFDPQRTPLLLRGPF